MGKGHGFQGSTGVLQLLKRELKHVPPQHTSPISDSFKHLHGHTIILLTGFRNGKKPHSDDSSVLPKTLLYFSPTLHQHWHA